ncbi:hypothetical protein GGI17_001249 [Coemansia sp. S146]|nr:hypothetical protein GGI17_001249 [Coemansia sp. S146]
MLWEVIHIVKSLPILSDLVCKSTGLGTYFEDIMLDMLPVYVRDIQVPLRERFRCWRLGDVDSDSLEETVTCILVVAMTFPNFSYANLPNSILHEYMELMKETIESDEGLGPAKVNSAKYTRTKLSPFEIDHVTSLYNKKVPSLNEIMAAAEDNGTMPSDAEFDYIAAQCGNKAPSWAELRKLYPPG